MLIAARSCLQTAAARVLNARLMSAFSSHCRLLLIQLFALDDSTARCPDLNTGVSEIRKQTPTSRKELPTNLFEF